MDDDVKRCPPGALSLPITALAREHTGKPIAAGMVAAGCVAALSDALSLDAIARSIEANMPAALVAGNRAACQAGHAATRAAQQEVTHV
jgi:Pyruvate/2-oxoacid:ferredoxin oxidoreductase gamma subunit